MNKYKKLTEAAFYAQDRVNGSEILKENFVSIDNMAPNKNGITITSLLPKGNLISFSVGDTLVGNIRPYLRKIWYADRNGGCSPDVLVFKAKQGIDSRFLYYSLFRDDFFSHMMKGSKGTKMPRGDKSQILFYRIPDFGIDDQKKIASVLSSLDAKIELNNRINAELEDMTKIIYDYWFVQFDFPDKNGKPYKSSGGKMVWSDELKREIPEGWKVDKLEKHIEIQRGISYTSKELNGLGIPMINLNSFNLDGTYKPEGIKTYSGKFSDKNIAKSGDLLIAATDVTRNADIIGKAVLVPDYYSKELVFSMDIAKITSKNIPSSFLMMLFNSIHYHNYIKWYATGTLVLHLNLDGVNRYMLEIPPGDLLEKFNDIYLPIAKRIFSTTKENQQLASMRDWLLPMLMNGQVTVQDTANKTYAMAAEPETQYQTRTKHHDRKGAENNI